MMFQPLIFRGVPLETLELHLALVLSSLSSLNYKQMSLFYLAFEPLGTSFHRYIFLGLYTKTQRLKFNMVLPNIKCLENLLETIIFRCNGKLWGCFSSYLILVFRIFT